MGSEQQAKEIVSLKRKLAALVKAIEGITYESAGGRYSSYHEGVDLNQFLEPALRRAKAHTPASGDTQGEKEGNNG